MAGAACWIPGSSFEHFRSVNTISSWSDSQGLLNANQTHKILYIVKSIYSPLYPLHLSQCLQVDVQWILGE